MKIHYYSQLIVLCAAFLTFSTSFASVAMNQSGGTVQMLNSPYFRSIKNGDCIGLVGEKCDWVVNQVFVDGKQLPHCNAGAHDFCVYEGGKKFVINNAYQPSDCKHITWIALCGEA